MKQITFTISFVASIICSYGQPAFDWAFSTGSDGCIYSAVSIRVQTDHSGNVYMAGHFCDTVDFDPGPGMFQLISAGSSDAFIAKYDAQGQFIWAGRIGGGLYTRILDMVLDKHANIYLTGYFRDSTDADPGPGVYPLDGDSLADIYVARFDSSGAIDWAFALGGKRADYGNGIAVDDSGYVYTSGTFGSDTVDFDPGPGVFNYIGQASSIFFARYDSVGNFSWAAKIGTYSSYDQLDGFCLDANGNLLASGRFHGSVDFDPGPGVVNLPGSTQYPWSIDVFLLKLTSGGQFSWARHFVDDMFFESITTDNAGNLFLAGQMSGYCDFDSIPAHTLSPHGNNDAFVCKLDSLGQYIWAQSFGDAGVMAGASSVILDSAIHVYVSGFYNGIVDFNASATAAFYLLAASTTDDAFVLQLDSSGSFNYAMGTGGLGTDRAHYLAVDGNDMYVTGSFSGQVDFDPGPGTFNLNSPTYSSLFLQKFHSGPVYAGNLDVGVISIYPNPSSGYFTLTSKTTMRSVKVTNQLGQVKLVDHPGSTKWSSQLTAGFYILTIETNAGTVTRKLIIGSN